MCNALYNRVKLVLHLTPQNLTHYSLICFVDFRTKDQPNCIPSTIFKCATKIVFI